MAATKISDIIIPTVFAPYVIEQIPKHSALVASGIVVPDANLDILARTGGKLINMPFFQDLTGDDELLSDSGSLTPGAIGTAQDIAALLMRGKAWGVNDLAKSLSGADPMAAIASLVAAYWAKREQAALIASLTGIFLDNVNDNSDLILDVVANSSTQTVANWMSAEHVIEAAGKLGDQLGVLTAMCMHSTPYMGLQKLQLIDYVAASVEERAATGSDTVPTFLGKRVIVDDSCPVVTDTTDGTSYEYTTYLFAQGAVGRGEGQAPVPVETDRDSLAGEDYLIHRRHFLLHVRGIAFISGSVSAASPSNTELALAANWNRVYPQKTIRVVKLVTNA